jgi:hypothetical protein
VRRIFEPKGEEISGDWRKSNNEELHNLYFSPNFTSVIELGRMGWEGNVARTGEIRSAYKMLVSKPEGRLSCRWKE